MTGAAGVPLPTAKQVRDVLAGIAGRSVEVGLGDPVVPGIGRSAAVAEYVTDRTVLGAVVVCDVALTVHASAGLGLVPPAVALEAVASRRVPDDLWENFQEVANIMASVFNSRPGAPHLALYRTHLPGGLLPPDVAACVARITRRVDLDVEIAQYGRGRVSLVAAGPSW